jgi:hypothetical protein
MFFDSDAVLWIIGITHAMDKMAAKNEKMSLLGHLGQSRHRRHFGMVMHKRIARWFRQ